MIVSFVIVVWWWTAVVNALKILAAWNDAWIAPWLQAYVWLSEIPVNQSQHLCVID